MTYHEGDLIEATKGERLVRDRIQKDGEGDLFVSGLGYFTNVFTGENEVENRGYSVRVLKHAKVQNRAETPLSEVLPAADGSPWYERLEEIYLLDRDWLGQDERPILVSAISDAHDIIKAAVEAGLTHPGIFPSSPEGVFIEWADTKRVANIEVVGDGVIELFDLNEGQVTKEASVSTTDEAIQFAIDVVGAEPNAFREAQDGSA